MARRDLDRACLGLGMVQGCAIVKVHGGADMGWNQPDNLPRLKGRLGKILCVHDEMLLMLKARHPSGMAHDAGDVVLHIRGKRFAPGVEGDALLVHGDDPARDQCTKLQTEIFVRRFAVEIAQYDAAGADSRLAAESFKAWVLEGVGVAVRA